MHAFPLIDDGLPSGIQEDLFSYLLNDPSINDMDNIDLDDNIICTSPASPPITSISSPSISVISSPVSSTSSPSPPPVSLAMLEKPMSNRTSVGLDRKIKLERSNSTGSSDEERQVKRQRRLLKNRESAQLSRLRKKVYIDDLEKKVTALSQDNDALTKKMAAIVENNKQLTEQVAQLQNMLKRSSKKQAIVAANNHSKKLQAAGVCMLMILFSFGLFFNMKAENNALQDPIRIGRVLTSIEEDVARNVDVPLVQMEVKKETEVEIQSVVAQPVSHKRAAPESTQPNKKKKGVKVEIKEEADGTGLVLSSVKSGPEQQQIDDIIRESSDSNFVYCSQPQVLWTPESSGVEMPNITFLVPSGNLGSTFHSNGTESETIMEINCQIIGVKFYPIRHSIN